MSTTTLPHEPLLQNIESVILPETDGVPLENVWHRLNINLLCESLGHHWRHRRDFFVGGNMCVYYSVEQARNRDFLGPDVFVTQGVDRDKLRDVWAIWQENNRGLDVAIELLSPSTANHDLTDKKDIYEQTLRTPEYFCYDPETQTLTGWRLDWRRHYQRIEPAPDGRLWSDELELWLGTWEGQYDDVRTAWLRWFDASGNLCQLPAEWEAERANAEAQRANAAEREVARLKQILAAQGVATDQ